MADKPKDARRTFGADLILPVLASLYAIYYVASVWDFPPEAQRSGMLLAGLMLFFSTLFFIRTAVRAVAGGWRFEIASVLGPEEGRLNRIGFVALILVYLLVVRHGGFTLTTFGFVLGASWLAGLRPVRRAAIFAAVAALAGWAFFIALLGTRFPEGPFERLVAALGA